MTAPNLPQPGWKSTRTRWLARGVILAVLLWNLSAALPFIAYPEAYAGAFELSGTVGAVLTRSIGVLFLMWVIPYLPAVLDPVRYRVCLAVILVQQGIGLTAESWMALTLPAGHASLRATGLRFIAFDAAGLVLLTAAWWLTRPAARDGARDRSAAES